MTRQVMPPLPVAIPAWGVWGVRRGLILPRVPVKVRVGKVRCSVCVWCHGPCTDGSLYHACVFAKPGAEYSCAHWVSLLTSWAGLRQAICHRDRGICARCGLSAGHDWECDHILRVVDGGTDDPTNLRTLCRLCHVEAGDDQRCYDAVTRALDLAARGVL